MRSDGVGIVLPLIMIGCVPFGVSSAFVALQLWSWFAVPAFRIAAPPPFLPIYCVFAIVGFLKSTRYVKDGKFDWEDAVISSLLNPGLLLLTGFVIHLVAIGFRG